MYNYPVVTAEQAESGGEEEQRAERGTREMSQRGEREAEEQ